MNLIDLFTFKGGSPASTSSDALPEIYRLSIAENVFVDTDVVTIYSKILTDVVERVNGLSDDQSAVLWDNCLKSNASSGLVTLLATAMANKRELFLVLDGEVLRLATPSEQAEIKADYEKTAESSVGTYISFKKYDRSDVVRLYSAMEFCTVAALNKTMNLSKAIQFKMSDLRSSVGAFDSGEVTTQAVAMAKALGEGRDVLMDAKDFIETSKPDLTAVKEAIAFLDSKRAFYLGLPTAYVTGDQASGLNATGEAETKAVERGLKSYYFSIIRPVLSAIFQGISLSYKSQDVRQVSQAIEAMKAFDLVSEDFVSYENKKRIIEGLLDLDAEDNETFQSVAFPLPAISPQPAGKKDQETAN